MKVLIWILTLSIGTIINALLGYATGIKVGSILLYIAECFVAEKLCKRWDMRQAEKNSTQSNNDYVNSSQAIKDTIADSTVNSDDNSLIENQVRKKILFCRRCGIKLVDGSEFCSNCGTKIEEAE